MKSKLALVAMTLLSSLSAHAFDSQVVCKSLPTAQAQLNIRFSNASDIQVAYALAGEGTVYSRGIYDRAVSTPRLPVYRLVDFNPGTTLAFSQFLFSDSQGQVTMNSVIMDNSGSRVVPTTFNCKVLYVHSSRND